MTLPGTALRNARTASRMQLAVAAEHVGVSAGYLSKVENGHVPPAWSLIERLATLYGRDARLRLLPAKDDAQRMAQVLLPLSPSQRLDLADEYFYDVLEVFDRHRVAFVVVGPVASILHGLPAVAEALALDVRDDDDELVRLGAALLALRTLFEEHGPSQLRAELAKRRRWPAGSADVDLRLVTALPAATLMRVGPLDVPVGALPQLLTDDEDVADSLDLLRPPADPSGAD